MHGSTVLADKINSLQGFEKNLTDVSKAFLSNGMNLYPLDMMAVAVVNRSLPLISGFITLIKNDNYIAGSHLVRPHLDNYLRFSAAWLVSDPHDFAMKVMQGERIDQLKDRNGKNLRDSYLVSEATKEYSWIRNVYKETSGFIHLSSKHVFTSTALKNLEERMIEFRISGKDKYVSDEIRLEAVEGIIAITECILNLLESWAWTKSNEA